MSLSRFLPLTLRRLLAEGRDLEEPLYLDGATLFADISGFTPLSEALARMGREGAETLTRTLNGYFTAVITAIQGNGGDVMRFAGDAVTAFFPDPGGVDRALTAAHAIQAFMGSHPETTSPVGSFPIRIKVGIAAGEHVLLVVGEGNAKDYVFAGHPVDGSAEAEHHAGPGEIVVKSKQFKVQNSKFKVEKAAEGFWRVTGSPSALETRNSKLETPAVDPNLSSLEKACAPFLHPILVERLGQGSERMMNEHRRAAVLFVSFPGVEDYRDRPAVSRLRAFYAEARSAVDRHEGNLNKVDMGDKGSKFLITFGAPLSHEDDADRAVHFALDLVDMAAAHGMALAVGLNRGTIFAGLIGDDQRCEYTVMGDDVNLAARLMQAAGPGRILAGPGVQEECRAFAFTVLPPVTLKGKSQPVPVFEPQGKEVEEKKGAGMFVGRGQELRACVEFVNQPGDEVRLLLVKGEAGIGKSAFLDQLFRQNLSGRRVVSGWCREFTSQFPYHPWKFILRKLLEIADPDGGDPAEAWKAILQGSVPELVPFAPILLDLVQIQHALPPAITDEQTRKSILHRQVDLLVQAARKQGPLALSLTDVQWMDPESGGLLEDLLRRLERPAPLILLSGRTLPDGIERMATAHRLELGLLPDADLKKIALAFLKVQRAPEKMLNDAAVASSGNPLLLQETLRAYLDAGYVTRDAQNPELLFLDEVRKPSLPTTLEGVVMARFDRLPANQQALLKTLSVFGEAIPVAVAHRAAESSGNDPALLDALADEGKSIMRQEAGDLCAFPQSHVRSTIYNSLDFTSRRDLHLLAARIYRDALPTGASESIQMVAFHYLQADAAMEGKEILLKAGRMAYEAYALPTALRFFQALMAQKSALDPDTQGTVAFYQSSILIKIGKFQQIQSLISTDLIAGLPPGDARARLLLLAADSYRLGGNYELAGQCIDQAVQNASSPLMLFQIKVLQGKMLAQTGQLHKALQHFDLLVKEFKGKVPPNEIVKLSVIRGPLLFSVGDQKAAFRTLDEAQRRLTAASEAQSLIGVLHNLGSFWGMSGQHGKSISAFRASHQYQEKFGIYQHLNFTLNEIGYESMLAGDWNEAQYYFDLSLSQSIKTGDPIQVRVLSNLAELCQCQGSYRSAKEYLERAAKASVKYGFEALQVLFYWLEFFAYLPYPRIMGRILKRFKLMMDRERAFYLNNLYTAYLAKYLLEIGKRTQAVELAEGLYAEARRQHQPKEAYLSFRTLYLCDLGGGDAQARSEILYQAARETRLDQLVLDAIILISTQRTNPVHRRKANAILGQSPFANLRWRFHLNLIRQAVRNNRTAEARRHAKEANTTFEKISASIPWRAVRTYFVNQPEAAELQELTRGLEPRR